MVSGNETGDTIPAPDHSDPLASMRLDGRVAVVTGASSGLGARFARTLIAAGATVIAVARRTDRLALLAAELPGLHPMTADLADAAEREQMIEAAGGVAGRIDILVNNAGILIRVAAEDEPLETFRAAMEINVVAPWHLSKLAFPHMCRAGGGSIINIASMYGLVASAPIKQANYCASKGALVNLTRELAAQWARRGIRVNSLCPGFFPSEMTEGLGEDDSSRTFIRANSPIPRVGLEHELDGALLLLASPSNTFMTGHNLVVDGGWTAR